MEVIKVMSGLVTIPPEISNILGWMVGFLAILVVLVSIDKTLKELTEKKITFIKIIKWIVTAICDGIKHRNGSIPLPISRRLKKVLSYLQCIAWGYGCTVFSALFISSILMFALRNNSLSVLQTFAGLGIILILGWCSKFAFIETQVSFNEARAI